MGAAARIIMAAEPLTLNRADALAYTGLAEKLFDQLERAGTIAGRHIGRRGEKVYYREHLQLVTAKLFGAGATDIDDEFEGLHG